MPKEYSEELRNQVIASFESGQASGEPCQIHGVARNTIYRLIKELWNTISQR